MQNPKLPKDRANYDERREWRKNTHTHARTHSEARARVYSRRALERDEAKDS